MCFGTKKTRAYIPDQLVLDVVANQSELRQNGGR